MKMKKIVSLLLVLTVLAALCVGCGSSSEVDQGDGTVNAPQEDANPNALGDYTVEIVSCRMAKDYEDAPAIIVKYRFTNVSDEEAAAFMFSVSDTAYQNGIELETALIFDDKYNYDSGNSMKEIKMGATLEVECAYVLEDTTSDVLIEVEEFFSFNNKVIKKTFQIVQ